MSFIGRNIRKIRAVKNLSQTAFSELFNLTRASIGAYEEGRAEPRSDTIISIAKYFGVTIDDLLTKELTVNDIHHFDVYKLQALRSKKASTKTPLITSMDYAGYAKNHKSAEYIGSLPCISLPHFDTTNRVFEFEAKNHRSVFSEICAGDLLICKKLDIENYTPNENSIEVLIINDLVLMGVVSQSSEKQQYCILQFNGESLKYHLTEVSEIWRLVSRVTSNLPNTVKLETRLALLEQRFSNLEQSVLNAKW